VRCAVATGAAAKPIEISAMVPRPRIEAIMLKARLLKCRLEKMVTVQANTDKRSGKPRPFSISGTAISWLPG
jgi:hypothetical protein